MGNLAGRVEVRGAAAEIDPGMRGVQTAMPPPSAETSAANRTTPGRHWAAPIGADRRSELTGMTEADLSAVLDQLAAAAARHRTTFPGAQAAFGVLLPAKLADAGFGSVVTGMAQRCVAPGRWLAALRLDCAGLAVTLLMLQTGRSWHQLGYDIPAADAGAERYR